MTNTFDHLWERIREQENQSFFQLAGVNKYISKKNNIKAVFFYCICSDLLISKWDTSIILKAY